MIWVAGTEVTCRAWRKHVVGKIPEHLHTKLIGNGYTLCDECSIKSKRGSVDFRWVWLRKYGWMRDIHLELADNLFSR